MINFKQREDILPSSLIVFSILLLIGTLAYMVIVPVPSAAGIAKGHDLSRTQIEKEITAAKKSSKQIQGAVQPLVWTGDPEQVTAQVLAKVTQETNRRGIKLGAFRPQKPQVLEGLQELPFSVQIAGPYADVEHVIAALDKDDSRIAISSVQVASGDAASSTVSATLSVSAYLLSADNAADTPTKVASAARTGEASQ